MQKFPGADKNFCGFQRLFPCILTLGLLKTDIFKLWISAKKEFTLFTLDVNEINMWTGNPSDNWQQWAFQPGAYQNFSNEEGKFDLKINVTIFGFH